MTLSYLQHIRCYLLFICFFYYLKLHRPPISTLFPYTTLFRSRGGAKQFAHWYLTIGSGALVPASADLRESDEVTVRSEEHTSELQSHSDIVCRLLLEKKNIKMYMIT